MEGVSGYVVGIGGLLVASMLVNALLFYTMYTQAKAYRENIRELYRQLLKGKTE